MLVAAVLAVVVVGLDVVWLPCSAAETLGRPPHGSSGSARRCTDRWGRVQRPFAELGHPRVELASQARHLRGAEASAESWPAPTRSTWWRPPTTRRATRARQATEPGRRFRVGDGRRPRSAAKPRIVVHEPQPLEPEPEPVAAPEPVPPVKPAQAAEPAPKPMASAKPSRTPNVSRSPTRSPRLVRPGGVARITTATTSTRSRSGSPPIRCRHAPPETSLGAPQLQRVEHDDVPPAVAHRPTVCEPMIPPPPVTTMVMRRGLALVRPRTYSEHGGPDARLRSPADRYARPCDRTRRSAR